MGQTRQDRNYYDIDASNPRHRNLANSSQSFPNVNVDRSGYEMRVHLDRTLSIMSSRVGDRSPRLSRIQGLSTWRGLSLTAAIADQTRTKSDLLYVNHSRAGALASSFSKFKHKIVEGRATEDLKSLLGQTRLNLDVVLNNSSPSFEPTLTQRISESRALRIISWLVLLKVIGTACYFTFRRKMPRSRRPASSRHSDKQTEPGRALRQEA